MAYGDLVKKIVALSEGEEPVRCIFCGILHLRGSVYHDCLKITQVKSSHPAIWPVQDVKISGLTSVLKFRNADKNMQVEILSRVLAVLSAKTNLMQDDISQIHKQWLDGLFL